MTADTPARDRDPARLPDIERAARDPIASRAILAAWAESGDPEVARLVGIVIGAVFAALDQRERRGSEPLYQTYSGQIAPGAGVVLTAAREPETWTLYFRNAPATDGAWVRSGAYSGPGAGAVWVAGGKTVKVPGIGTQLGVAADAANTATLTYIAVAVAGREFGI